METSLHRQLKESYADDLEHTEVVVGRFRIDAIRNGELVEIQCGSLAALRDKVTNLLSKHRVRVVKPIIGRKRIIHRKRANGPISSRRFSPKRGELLQLFDELVYFTSIFPHAQLTLDVPIVHVDEFRLPPVKDRRRRRRKARHRVEDIVLTDVVDQQEFHCAEDLLSILDTSVAKDLFNTADLAEWIDRPRWVAQRVAYVLRNTGAAEVVGKKGNTLLYRFAPSAQAACAA